MFVILNSLWMFSEIRVRKGMVSALFIFLYGIFRIILEQFREPDAQLGFFFGNVTMGQILSVPLVLVGIVVFVKAFRKV